MTNEQEVHASTVEVVQRQLDAYNRHDLEAFLATYHDDATLHRMPGEHVVARGKHEIAALYSAKVFAVEGHRADLLGRLVAGNQVVDHERVYGLSDRPVEAIAVYRLESGLIHDVWFFRSD